MADEKCIFCEIASGRVPSVKIYDDDKVLAFLDIAPISDGHTLVIPKQHCGKLHECPPELAGHIVGVVGRLAKAVADAMQADGYNVLCNNGLAAGQVVDHLHLHIIPRRNADGVFDRWPAHVYEKGKIENIADKIRANL